MKKRMILILAALLLCGCSTPAASQGTPTPETTPEITPETTPEPSEEVMKGQKALVLYFSRVGNMALNGNVDVSSSASIQQYQDQIVGNTGVVAMMIQEITGAELMVLETAEQYPVSYDETLDVGRQERDEAARPELALALDNFDEYDTIYMGFPVWWYDMPMAIYSFLESYDLSGKTIVPFATSGGSGFSESDIAELQPNAEVLEGLVVGANSITNAKEQVNTWLTDLGLLD